MDSLNFGHVSSVSSPYVLRIKKVYVEVDGNLMPLLCLFEIRNTLIERSWFEDVSCGVILPLQFS
jgi:hypothetical protein